MLEVCLIVQTDEQQTSIFQKLSDSLNTFNYSEDYFSNLFKNSRMYFYQIRDACNNEGIILNVP